MYKWINHTTQNGISTDIDGIYMAVKKQDVESCRHFSEFCAQTHQWMGKFVLSELIWQMCFHPGFQHMNSFLEEPKNKRNEHKNSVKLRKLCFLVCCWNPFFPMWHLNMHTINTVSSSSSKFNIFTAWSFGTNNAEKSIKQNKNEVGVFLWLLFSRQVCFSCGSGGRGLVCLWAFSPSRNDPTVWMCDPGQPCWICESFYCQHIHELQVLSQNWLVEAFSSSNWRSFQHILNSVLKVCEWVCFQVLKTSLFSCTCPFWSRQPQNKTPAAESSMLELQRQPVTSVEVKRNLGKLMTALVSPPGYFPFTVSY